MVMLLRNIRPDRGNVNGTMYVVIDMTDNLLFLQSIFGTHHGDRIALPELNSLLGQSIFQYWALSAASFR